MAYAPFTFNKIQAGVEVTPGTAVASTFIFRGSFGSAKDESTRKVVVEQVGQYVPTGQVIMPWQLAKLAMPAMPFTFEQSPHIFEASVKTATPGATPQYKRTYNSPVSAPPTTKFYTLECFNTEVSADYREIPHAYVEEWTLSGKSGEEWMIAANWVGRRLETGSPTTLSALVTTEIALFSKTKLYIDAAGGTIHTTQKTGVLMAAEMKYASGIMYVPVGDGNLYYSTVKYGPPKFTYSLTVELESASVVGAERTAYEANTLRLISLDCPGSNANKNLRVDMAGRHTAIGNYENQDGNTTVTIDGEATYDSVSTMFMSVIVDNATAAL
jgi:hypothetical protein